MSLQLKTFAVLFAALTLSVSAAAQTMIASVQTDKKSNTVKVATKPAPKAPAAAAAPAPAKKAEAVAAKKAAAPAENVQCAAKKAECAAKKAECAVKGSLVPLKNLPKLGKFKKSEVDMTGWKLLPEYFDEVFAWFELPDGRLALVYKCSNKPATVYSVFMQENQKLSSGREIIPAEIAMSGLQPACKDLNVLTVCANRHLTDGLAAFPLTRKLLAVSSMDSTGLYRLLGHAAGEFDLIVLELPMPDNLYALRMYSPENLLKIRQALSEDGVLAVFLPDDVPLDPAGLHRRSGLHDLTGKTLKTIFPSVKRAGGELPLLFCGGENVTNSPEELNRRARELKLMPAYLPDDAFSLLPPPENQTPQADIGFQGLGLMWEVIRKNLLIDRMGLGELLDRIWSVLLPGLTGILILLLVIRYFFSGGTANKRNWLSLENGLYLGLTAVLLLVPYQLNTGRLDPDWLSLTGIFLIAAFAGMLASAGHRHSKLLQKLLLGVSLLAPWCGLAFLHGYYLPDPLVYYALAGYVGYTSGMIAADIRSEPPVILAGFGIGLLLGILLCWLPDGAVWAPVLAVLCRIPPLAAENLQKQFEKSPGRG